MGPNLRVNDVRVHKPSVQPDEIQVTYINVGETCFLDIPEYQNINTTPVGGRGRGWSYDHPVIIYAVSQKFFLIR